MNSGLQLGVQHHFLHAPCVLKGRSNGCVGIDRRLAIHYFRRRIGDSHIYLYRDGTLEQLNIDHNFGAQLDQMALEGSITQDEALHHPQRAALTSYLGISELTLISGNRMPFQLRKGDVLIQCTDGLYRYLPDSTMCRILAVTGNLKQAAEQMVKTALAVPGGHDNTSVLLARYKG